MGTLNDRDTIRYSLQEMKDIFTEKFLLLQDKSSFVCQEIYPGGIRLAE